MVVEGIEGRLRRVQPLLDRVQSLSERLRHRWVVREVAKVGDEGGALFELRRHRQLLLQMLLTRAADAFLLYVSAVLAVVFRSRPATLRSSEQVKVDFVLAHQTMEELVADLAERRVTALSYQGMVELVESLRERLGLALFANRNDLDRAVRIVETRNLIVHNRGVVNRRFLSRVADFPADEGDVLAAEHRRIR